jgi:tetratricopeptide (TPR) repeat protein
MPELPDLPTAATDPRQILFLALMALLLVTLVLLERRRQHPEQAVPMLQPPRRLAGPLAWDGPADELPEEALFAMARSDWPTAHRALWEHLTAAPSDWLYYHLGLALAHQGRLGEAETCYRAALDISPAIAEAHYNLGNVLLETGRWSEAIVAYKTALKARPDWTDALVNLGHVYFQLRMADEAHREWLRAIQLEPRARDVQANLRFVRRLRLAEQARSKKPA